MRGGRFATSLDMAFLLALVGTVILLITAVDIVWTTLGTHGGGPVTSPLTNAVWQMALKSHRRSPNHRALSVVGSVILVIMVAVWISLIWGAWLLIFLSHPESVVDAGTHLPADLASRIYYVGFVLFTLGNGDFVPTSSVWRILTSLACATGIGSLSVAITFILQVLTTVVEKRSLGAYISDIGETPEEILLRAWDGEKLAGLDQHLVMLTSMVHLYAEQHLAYPVTRYFHAEHQRAATTLRLAVLYDSVLLISEGVAPHQRLPFLTTGPLRHAIHAAAALVGGKASRYDDPPEAPSLSILRELGIDTVEESTFAEAVRKATEVRKSLRRLVVDDGWKWEYVNDLPRVQKETSHHG